MRRGSLPGDMSDDAPRRAKHGTVPGFGHPKQPLPPLEVQPIAAEDPSVIDAPAQPDALDLGGHEPPSGALQLPPEARMPLDRPAEHRPRPKGPPAVDIDLVYERRSAPLPDQPWVFLEIWTRNTIYQLDASLTCVDVIDQATRRSIADHALRGARLVGGQSRDGDAMELSHPFPRPGSEAVFEQASGRHVRFSQTSSVTRVVMRLRVLTVEPDQLLPTWEGVSGSWDARAVTDKKK